MPTVRLLKPHCHAGKDYPAGAALDVASHAAAAWLIRRGLAEIVAQAAAECAPEPLSEAPLKTRKRGRGKNFEPHQE
ncbi:MAG: hypothetical protein LBQ75_09370 [Zoogloeaceae bacterium]|nr:hypothetical protein [Zoogloeaceae bacterium]